MKNFEALQNKSLSRDEMKDVSGGSTWCDWGKICRKMKFRFSPVPFVEWTTHPTKRRLLNGSIVSQGCC